MSAETCDREFAFLVLFPYLFHAGSDHVSLGFFQPHYFLFACCSLACELGKEDVSRHMQGSK